MKHLAGLFALLPLATIAEECECGNFWAKRCQEFETVEFGNLEVLRENARVMEVELRPVRTFHGPSIAGRKLYVEKGQACSFYIRDGSELYVLLDKDETRLSRCNVRFKYPDETVREPFPYHLGCWDDEIDTAPVVP